MTGMALVNDELSARFLPEFLKGLARHGDRVCADPRDVP